jgi:hypothetical protein
MKIIGEINNQIISFVEYDTSKNWIKDFPNENWGLIIIAEARNTSVFNEVIGKSIERNVSCICSVGKQHDLIHEMVDEEIVFREVDMEDLYLPKHMITTLSNRDFENGIWEGIYLANIGQIVILDVTKNARAIVAAFIAKLEDGYLPA